MSKVYVIGDLHFGHRQVTRFRKEFESDTHHEEHIMDNWNDLITKRDIVYVMGDAAFDMVGLAKIGKLPGIKYLVRGNHDKLTAAEYLYVFDDVYGIIAHKGIWLSHAPIHVQELWGRPNIHGHVHFNTIPDDWYFNVSAENIGYTPKDFYEIRATLFNRCGIIKESERQPL